MEKQMKAIIAVLILLTAGGIGLVVANNMSSDGAQPERIGIIGAMECEVRDVKQEMVVDHTETIADMEYAVGKISGHDVVVVQCGMGKVNAGICVQTLVTKFNVKTVINSGAAGSLDETLRIGDFVISTDVVQYDYDVSAIGYEKGEIPYTGHVSFAADASLREKALAAVKESAPKSQVIEGRICTGDAFVSTQAQKDAILAAFGGKCCEMEGGAVAHACYLNNVPFVIIRAISDDTSGEQFIDHMEEIGQMSAHAVIKVIKSL